MDLIPCPGCGGLFPETEGPTHRYMESSPGCWAAYGEILAREYNGPAKYGPVLRLSVDAFAVQHPGRPSPQAIQSVAIHLIRLCLLLERKMPVEKANEIMLAATKRKADFFWLDPPDSLGEITVADIHRAGTVEEHMRLVRDWAEGAWRAWQPHHEQIRAWLPQGW
jgi:hypothetical protein